MIMPATTGCTRPKTIQKHIFWSTGNFSSLVPIARGGGRIGFWSKKTNSSLNGGAADVVMYAVTNSCRTGARFGLPSPIQPSDTGPAANILIGRKVSCTDYLRFSF